MSPGQGRPIQIARMAIWLGIIGSFLFFWIAVGWWILAMMR
jgi:hypothetical protein